MEGTWQREAWLWGPGWGPRAGGQEHSGSAAPLSQPFLSAGRAPLNPRSEPPLLQPCSPKGRQGAWGLCRRSPHVPIGTVQGMSWCPNSHRAQLPALPGVGECGWVCAPHSWAKSCSRESRGDEVRARRDGFLVPDECRPSERSYHRSIPHLCQKLPRSIKAPTRPLVPQLRLIPLPWQGSLVHTKPCSWLAQMAPPCLSFPTWKMGAAAPTPTLSCSAHPWVALFNTGAVPTSFCSFPLPRIYLDGDAGSAGSWPQQSLPGTQPSPLPSPAGCCGGGGCAPAEHPTGGPGPTRHTSQGKRGGKRRRLGEHHA